MGNKAKKPKKSSEERARERYQKIELDQQISESEQKFKALARNKLGAQSLLGGADRKQTMDSAAPQSQYETRKISSGKSTQTEKKIQKQLDKGLAGRKRKKIRKGLGL